MISLIKPWHCANCQCYYCLRMNILIWLLSAWQICCTTILVRHWLSGYYCRPNKSDWHLIFNCLVPWFIVIELLSEVLCTAQQSWTFCILMICTWFGFNDRLIKQEAMVSCEWGVLRRFALTILFVRFPFLEQVQ